MRAGQEQLKTDMAVGLQKMIEQMKPERTIYLQKMAARQEEMKQKVLNI